MSYSTHISLRRQMNQQKRLLYGPDHIQVSTYYVAAGSELKDRSWAGPNLFLQFTFNFNSLLHDLNPAWGKRQFFILCSVLLQFSFLS